MKEDDAVDKPDSRRRETLSGEVKRLISERIASGRYALGSRLPSEQDMIAEFGVSRTVIREAIANLKASGIVKTIQGSGAFVAKPDKPAAFEIEEASNLSTAQELVRIMELRIAVEVEAVTLASRRRTEVHLATLREAMTPFSVSLSRGDFSVEAGERCANADIAFHRAISEATGNSHFLRLYNYLSEYTHTRSQMRSLKFGGGSPEEYVRRTAIEHDKIYRAIETGDSDSARAAIYLHLAGSRDRLRRLIKEVSPS